MTRFFSKTHRANALVAAAITISALITPVTASAALLIDFDDNTPSIGVADPSSNRAVSWTQTVATSNVSLRALLFSNSPAPTNWWLTTAIGPSTTLVDVVATGAATPAVTGIGFVDFDPLARTTIATGLNLGAGTYYLVFENIGFYPNWEALRPTDSTILAPGFTLGSNFRTFAPTAFNPSATFVVSPNQYIFELDGLVSTAVPEPTTMSLMLLGVAGIATGRARRRTKA